MSWCCCCGYANERHDIRSKEKLREIKKLGGKGVLFEEFDLSGNRGPQDPESNRRLGVNQIGRVPMLILMLDEEPKVIEACKDVIEVQTNSRVVVVAIVEEFIIIGPIDVDYEKALKELRHVAGVLIEEGLCITENESFVCERVNIRLYPDPEAPDPGELQLNRGASEPLLSRRNSKRHNPRSDRVCWLCCCCCNSAVDPNKPFVFDTWEKSEFGWFYTEVAKANGEENLRKSIDRIDFTSDTLNSEQLVVLVDFFISYYFWLNSDLPENRDEESVTNFRNELVSYLKKHYDNSPIDSEDVVKWFTREMPRHYVWRSTQLAPERCPSCVIS